MDLEDKVEPIHLEQIKICLRTSILKTIKKKKATCLQMMRKKVRCSSTTYIEWVLMVIAVSHTVATATSMAEVMEAVVAMPDKVTECNTATINQVANNSKIKRMKKPKTKSKRTKLMPIKPPKKKIRKLKKRQTKQKSCK